MTLVLLALVPPLDNWCRLGVAQWVFGAGWHRRKSFRDGVVPCRSPVLGDGSDSSVYESGAETLWNFVVCRR